MTITCNLRCRRHRIFSPVFWFDPKKRSNTKKRKATTTWTNGVQSNHFQCCFWTCRCSENTRHSMLILEAEHVLALFLVESRSLILYSLLFLWNNPFEYFVIVEWEACKVWGMLKNWQKKTWRTKQQNNGREYAFLHLNAFNKYENVQMTIPPIIFFLHLIRLFEYIERTFHWKLFRSRRIMRETRSTAHSQRSCSDQIKSIFPQQKPVFFVKKNLI